jgi:hypothetical protein
MSLGISRKQAHRRVGNFTVFVRILIRSQKPVGMNLWFEGKPLIKNLPLLKNCVIIAAIITVKLL